MTQGYTSNACKYIGICADNSNKTQKSEHQACNVHLVLSLIMITTQAHCVFRQLTLSPPIPLRLYTLPYCMVLPTIFIFYRASICEGGLESPSVRRSVCLSVTRVDYDKTK